MGKPYIVIFLNNLLSQVGVDNWVHPNYHSYPEESTERKIEFESTSNIAYYDFSDSVKVYGLKSRITFYNDLNSILNQISLINNSNIYSIQTSDFFLHYTNDVIKQKPINTIIVTLNFW